MGRFYRVFRNRPDHVGFHILRISTLLMDIHRYFWLTLGNQFLSSTQALSIASISFKGLKNCAILKTNITERLHDMQGGKNPVFQRSRSQEILSQTGSYRIRSRSFYQDQNHLLRLFIGSFCLKGAPVKSGSSVS